MNRCRCRPALKEVRSIRLGDLTTCSHLQTSLGLRALPRAGVHGREHARPFNSRLREVFRENGDSVLNLLM
jgi:hypothetical protein